MKLKDLYNELQGYLETCEKTCIDLRKQIVCEHTWNRSVDPEFGSVYFDCGKCNLSFYSEDTVSDFEASLLPEFTLIVDASEIEINQEKKIHE